MVFNITSSILTALKFELSKLRFNTNCINSIDIDVNNDNKKLDFIFINFLLYIKANTFNKQRLPIQTCRHCGGEYKDYGGYKHKMNILGVNIADVWYDIFPVRNGKNRLYNELSVKLLDRVISFSSNKGDLILDPFGGSGTTYAVAELLDRNWVGIELGDCEVIKNRLL